MMRTHFFCPTYAITAISTDGQVTTAAHGIGVGETTTVKLSGITGDEMAKQLNGVEFVAEGLDPTTLQLKEVGGANFSWPGTWTAGGVIAITEEGRGYQNDATVLGLEFETQVTENGSSVVSAQYECDNSPGGSDVVNFSIAGRASENADWIFLGGSTSLVFVSLPPINGKYVTSQANVPKWPLMRIDLYETSGGTNTGLNAWLLEY